MTLRCRALGVALALPFALFAYNPLHAVASPAPAASCAGRPATMVVTAHSPRVVHGTSHRDVIVTKVPGHVIDAGGYAL